MSDARTAPLGFITILGHTVAENPHYVSPEDFLARPGAPWGDERREALSSVRLTSRTGRDTT